MRSIDFESAVAEFLALGRRFQEGREQPADSIVDEFARWYRDVRINEASVFESNDMLLLEWGTMRPEELSEPTDFRSEGSYAGFKYADRTFTAIRLTRQVVPAAGHAEPQFDELAVNLAIMLCFDVIVAEGKGGDSWIGIPEEVDSALIDVREQPLLEPLLVLSPQRVIATVSGAG